MQETDLGPHKAESENSRARELLGRAADLLLAIMYQILLHASLFGFEWVDISGSTIHLIPPESSGGGIPVWIPFPVLSNSFAKELLNGKYLSTVTHHLHGSLFLGREVNVSRIQGLKSLKQRLDVQTPDPDPLYHTVYRVTLKNGWVWQLIAQERNMETRGLSVPGSIMNNIDQPKLSTSKALAFPATTPTQTSRLLPSQFIEYSVVERTEGACKGAW
ncbi:hypothetical protein OCU04_000258 [Sclerotinia nivalis]|uniref:Uncharacterized protein n=1 Tax=Sclerotinia nivalis TaxID=352851 RepID=A0A9X0DNK0_9HELO|nr:hypothetical protein OCU04_000258 [Sclerotinia nivalis]